MQTFDQHLIQLLRSQQVTEDTARHYANNWNRLEMELHGFVSSQPGILKPDPGR
jgi:Tfp pilus assembly ATPase PilU